MNPDFWIGVLVGWFACNGLCVAVLIADCWRRTWGSDLGAWNPSRHRAREPDRGERDW